MYFIFAFFLCLPLISIYEFGRSDFYFKLSLIELKAVGGYGTSQSESSIEGSTERSIQEENNDQSSEESSVSQDEKDLGEGPSTLKAKSVSTFFSNGNSNFKEKLGENTLSFNSYEELVKFLLYESNERDLGLSFSDCLKVSQAYLTSKFTPNTSENEIVVNIKELLMLLRKYIRTNGSCLQSFSVKNQPKMSVASTGSTLDIKEENDSDTDSSVKTNQSTSSDASSDKFHGSPGGHSQFLFSTSFNGVSPASIEFLEMQPKSDSRYELFQQDHSSPTQDEFAQSEENLRTPTSDLNHLSMSEPENVPPIEENPNIVYEEIGTEIRVSQDDVVPNLDFNTRSTIPITEVELELDLVDPWKSLISMILYEPVRRSSLKFDETHCDKIAKVTGRIIAYMTKYTCKLRLIIKSYQRKKCNERNKVASLFVGCYKLKKQLEKNIKYYSKLRYDLVDSIVAVTQCSLAKNNYMSQRNKTFSHLSDGNSSIRCTLKEYYLLFDFEIFLFYIINAYKSAVEKLEKLISSSCTTICPTKCGKRPQICNCLEESYNNIFADRINMETYRHHLSNRMLLCKNYLISNYLFSSSIPESAEYVSTSGHRYKIENFGNIQTVQFPITYPSSLEKFTILKSNLFKLLLSAIDNQEQPPNPAPVAKEVPKKSRNLEKKPKDRLKSKFPTRRSKIKNTNNYNTQTHPEPTPNPQNNWL
ncbi:hypothetical protein CmeUKMEL1_02925 [Cryptosporidium meleagridis]|uniref:Integral membrane protein n=1 Tax=Cryptosporidium meleagridis TaxID=93969 RepID=A0A2P4YXL0_9CRYT|nr:hypothetical protein CmeUKMEL1_02925 [Cryptosporidium meleagridis]